MGIWLTVAKRKPRAVRPFRVWGKAVIADQIERCAQAAFAQHIQKAWCVSVGLGPSSNVVATGGEGVLMAVIAAASISRPAANAW